MGSIKLVPADVEKVPREESVAGAMQVLLDMDDAIMSTSIHVFMMKLIFTNCQCCRSE